MYKKARCLGKISAVENEALKSNVCRKCDPMQIAKSALS